jgi:thioredoxin reductase
VIIVGGGPAGLNAALILARCLRKIILFDHGKPRNASSQASHGFLSRDGINPLELLRISKQELEAYNVPVRHVEIVDAAKEENFRVTDENGEDYYCKKLLIATGLKDLLPKIEGINRFYGKSVWHCPYCDGYENRFTKLAAYGYHKSAVGLALSLTNWSEDIILFTDGQELRAKDYKKLNLHNVQVIHKKVLKLEGGDYLENIVLEDGELIPRNGLFFTTEQYQRSHIAEELGCEFLENNVVETDKFQQSSVPGLFVAGDAARDVQLLVIAAAEGAKAAVIINKMLQKEEMKLKSLDAELKK